MADNNKELREIVKDFTKETTFHGLKYIAEDSRFVSRRIAWIIVIVSVIIVFTYAVSDRLMYFYTHPSNIELEVRYQDNIPFPAVTLCNENPYRLTALQKNGMYDVIKEATAPKVEESDGLNSCNDQYSINTVICHLPNNVVYIENITETTASMCKLLCSSNSSVNCSGFIYQSTTRLCTLTSYTGEDQMWFTHTEVEVAKNSCKKRKTFYYRKIRCVDNRRIFCTFEETPSNDIISPQCRFYFDESKTEQWQIVEASYTDVTLKSVFGHYIYLLETNTRPGNEARIYTDYINTTNKCIFMFVALFGDAEGSFRVSLEDESLKQIVLQELDNFVTLKSIQKTLPGYLPVQWIRLFSALPSGLHRIRIEAIRGMSNTGGFAVDNIEVIDSQDMYQNCIHSNDGMEYLGNTSHNAFGRCLPWTVVHDVYAGSSGQTLPIALYLPDLSWKKAKNFCRNFAGILTRAKGSPVGCFHGFDSNNKLIWGGCSVERCPCLQSEFECGNKVCIQVADTCNRVPNCIDHTDELSFCDSKRTLSCYFEDEFLCGYVTDNTVATIQLETEGGSMMSKNKVLRIVPGQSITLGETAQIRTPIMKFKSNSEVKITVKTTPLSSKPSFLSFWLSGTYGMSKSPILVHQQPIDMEDDWQVYQLCIPGGDEIEHRLIIQAVFNSDDVNFYIKDIITEEHSTCTVTAVFPSKDSINCDFQTDLCGYISLSDHSMLEWASIPKDNMIRDNAIGYQLFERSKQCTNCYQYENKYYSAIHLTTSGIITSPGFPLQYPNKRYQLWLIDMPEGSTINITFSDFSVQEADGCTSDFLQLIEKWPLNTVTRLCGDLDRNVSRHYAMQTSRVRLVFRSNGWHTASGFRLQYVAVAVQPFDTAIGLRYMGTPALKLYSSKLLSPVLNPVVNHCLSFEYEKLGKFQLYFSFLNGTSILIYEDKVKLDNYAWTKVMVNIYNLGHVGSFLEFLGQKPKVSYPMKYFTFIANIKVLDGLCEDVNIQGNVTCDFEDVNQCGYYDSSASPNKWRRVVLNTGSHAMGVFLNNNNNISGELLSPISALTINSCLSLTILFYQPICLSIHLKNTHNLLMETIPPQCIQPAGWTIRSINVNISAGTYRFGFAVDSPKQTNVYVDNISLQSGTCSQTTVLQGHTVEYTSTNPATISASHETTVTPTSIVPVTTSLNWVKSQTTDPGVYTVQSGNFSNKTHRHISDLYVNNEDAAAVIMDSLNEDTNLFWQKMAQQQSSLIIKCLWNGGICNSSYMSHTITDKGSCYSFNSNPIDGKFLTSVKASSVFGLSLTLNIEDYEHVYGIGTDSGIKIHFYDPMKVPLMKTSGNAVGPGTHSLFSLKYTESSFLAPKYGTCNTVDLPMYPNVTYTTTHCFMECFTRSLTAKCNCIMPYMPGSNSNKTRICNIDDLYSCVNLKSTAGSASCDCPDACYDASYEVELSDSKLSGLALTTILGSKEESAKLNFHNALNIQHRIKEGYFVELLTKMKSLPELILDMKNFVISTTQQLGNLIESAISKIITITISDTRLTLNALSSSHSLYTKYIGPERENLASRFTKLQRNVDDLAYEIKWSYNPCVDYGSVAPPSALVSQLDNIIVQHKQLNNLILGYISIYDCKMYSDFKGSISSCETDPTDLSLFPNFTMLGLSWAENVELPEKTVLHNDINTFCRNFLNTTWRKVYKERNFNLIGKIKNSLKSYNKKSSCELSRQYLKNPPYNEKLEKRFETNPFIMLNSYKVSTSVFDYQTTVKFLDQLSVNLKEMSQNLDACLMEYGNYLTKSLKATHDSIDGLVVMNVTFNKISENEVMELYYFVNSFNAFYNGYKSNRLSKEQIMDNLLSQGRTFKNLPHLKEWLSYFNGAFQQRLLSDNTPMLSGVKYALTTTYKRIIDDFLSMTEYLGQSNAGDVFNNLSIFRKPVPKIESASTKYLLSSADIKAKFGKDLTSYLSDNGIEEVTSALSNYFTELQNILSGHYTVYLAKETEIFSLIQDIETILQDYRTSLLMGSAFIGSNLMQVDVYFQELKSTTTTQSVGYSMMDFFSDLGGYLGLLLGASIITVCEVLDLIIYNILTSTLEKKEESEEKKQPAKPEKSTSVRQGAWFSSPRNLDSSSNTKVVPFDSK